MEKILKELESKDLSKKEIFDFLYKLDINKICGREYRRTYNVYCDACNTGFVTQDALDNHYNKHPICLKWNSMEHKPNNIQIDKAIHLVVTEIADKATGTGVENEHKCKHCCTSFVSKSNLNKHYNYSVVCNKLAYLEFKQLYNSLET
jgi:hypothetical protein